MSLMTRLTLEQLRLTELLSTVSGQVMLVIDLTSQPRDCDSLENLNNVSSFQCLSDFQPEAGIFSLLEYFPSVVAMTFSRVR